MTTSEQQNENHAQVNADDEHALRTRTLIQALKQQRDQAQDAVVVLNGDKAVLEHRLNVTNKAYNNLMAQYANSQTELAANRIANANLDATIKSLKLAIESFYREVESVCDIEELRKRLGVGEDDEPSEDGEEAEPPKTFVQRFLSAFNLGPKN
jgi:chromosome segregation ATPase